MTQNRFLKAGLVGLCLLLPMGCDGTQVKIHQYSPEQPESINRNDDTVSISGSINGFIYTPRAENCNNRIVFSVKNSNRYSTVYIEGSQFDGTEENLNYSISASKIKTLYEINSKVTVVGKKDPRGIRMKSIEGKLGDETLNIEFK